MEIQQIIEIAKKASIEAGEKIMEIYNSADFGIELKGDKSPLTLADKAAHNVIVSYLEKTNLPILSEEGKNINFEERKKWEMFWMVDPLDGTKEFIKKNGEFTVNIALIKNNETIAGVIYAPVFKQLFWGIKGEGAWKTENEITSTLKISKHPIEVIVASRSHLSQETEDFIKDYPNAKTLSMGSSFKFLLIAENKAQIYPRFAPTMEWDTAAGQAIVEAAGGEVINWETKSKMLYNKNNLLNAWFLVKN